jgi:uncharacterized protein YaiE (UPF0345 family)
MYLPTLTYYESFIFQSIMNRGLGKCLAIFFAACFFALQFHPIGEYQSDHNEKPIFHIETMNVVSGALIVQLPGQEQWQTFEANEKFTVQANQKFKVQVKGDTVYLCTYG